MGYGRYELPEEGWGLFTRGGTHDVYIQKRGDDKKISIPQKLIRSLVAEDVLRAKIAELEQMEDDDILKMLLK